MSSKGIIVQKKYFMASLDYFAQQELDKIRLQNKLRSLKICDFSDSKQVVFEGKKLISFATNDYFGMASDPRVKKVAMQAVEKYGVGSRSARLICGNYGAYEELELNLAKVKNSEKAVVFGSGYLTAIGVIPALVGRGDLVVADKLIHASLLDGIKLSGATLKRYYHNDYQHCKKLLEEERSKYKNCLLVSETIFSMDGDMGNVGELLSLASDFKTWLLMDDAHGFAIVDNAEIVDHFRDNYIQIGTLSKAIGSYGGYVTASKNICDYIITKAKSFIYTTSLPYPVVVAANEAVKILYLNQEIKNRLQQNIEIFTTKMGLEKQISPIFIIELSSIEELHDVHQKLIDNGMYVGSIRPPTSSSPRLRITLSAQHSELEIKRLCQLLSTRAVQC